MTRIILNPDGKTDLHGMVRAAEQAMAYEVRTRSSDGTDVLKDMGLRVDGVFYAVRFNKSSVSVRKIAP